MRTFALAMSLLLLSSQALALEVAGALYLERKTTSREGLLDDPGDKLIRMYFVYRKVEKEKIVEAFADGLRKNPPAVAGTADANAFLSWFGSDFIAGDRVDIALASDGTVSADRNGRRLGTLRNPDLSRAVLRIWFGEKPADSGLEKGMLGLD